MVLYHGAALLDMFYGIKIPLYDSTLLNILQEIFACAFIVISGISCRLSRSNARRGVICFAAGLLVTAVTFAAVPDSPVTFGILHFLGVCMVLFSALHGVADKIPPLWGMAVCALLFLFTYGVSGGSVFFGLITLPKALFRTGLLTPLGFIRDSYSSVDFFPLLPYAFVFFFGAYLGRLITEGKCPEFAYKIHSRFLAFTGRHTLWIYLAHQPVLFALMQIFVRK